MEDKRKSKKKKATVRKSSLTTYRGVNSINAKKVYRDAKRKWRIIVSEEVEKEKKKKRPHMPNALKVASKRYKSVKISWADALRKFGSPTKKRTKKE